MKPSRLLLAALVLAAPACESSKPTSKPAPEASAASPKEAPAADGAKPAEGAKPAAVAAPAAVQVDASFAGMWDLPIKTLDGKPTTLGAFKGKAVLVVNVASQCGLTPQYTQLEALQKQYADKGFTVVGFPCNQFGGQEPGSAEEIAEFCSTQYGVTFPMMEKIEVNGAGRHPVYQALTPIADASGHTGDIRWNFEKFLISADGTQVTRFSPKTKPDDPTVIAALEAALPK
jgi:glutathione peroxidase